MSLELMVSMVDSMAGQVNLYRSGTRHFKELVLVELIKSSQTSQFSC